MFFELSIKLKKNVSQFTQKYLAAQLFFLTFIIIKSMIYWRLEYWMLKI